MNPGLKIKSLYIIVGLLLMINVATLGFIWYTSFKLRVEPPLNPPRQDSSNSFLADELGFTGEQSQKFEALKKEHRQGVQNIMQQTKELKDQLFECIKTGDDAKAKELAEKLSENNKAMELLTYEHFKEVRKICNDEQKVKFDKILIELVRGLEAQSPPPNGHPPGERPPQGDRPPPPGDRPPGR
jgi:Spy/CpxP family protein refolding chaperone